MPLAKNPTAIRVVCIALIDDRGRVLLHKRRAGGTHGGLWEFPGGKIEPGETSETALVREIAEELGIAVAAADLRAQGASAGQAEGGMPLVLFLYSCTRWSGEPRCLEGEAMGWFTALETGALAVPPLDRPFVAQLAAIVAGARPGAEGCG